MQQRGVLPQPHGLLRADALQRGMHMARQHFLDTNVRGMQKTRGGSRRCPAMTCRRHTADRALAQPIQTLRVPHIMPLALGQLCFSLSTLLSEFLDVSLVWATFER